MSNTTQAREALAWANEVRLSNATYRREVLAMSPRAGAEYVADSIEQDWESECLGSIPMDRLLMSVRRLGAGKMSRCLTVAGVSYHHKRLRDLTERQRVAVAAQLRLWGAGYRA